MTIPMMDETLVQQHRVTHDGVEGWGRLVIGLGIHFVVRVSVRPDVHFGITDIRVLFTLSIVVEVGVVARILINVDIAVSIDIHIAIRLTFIVIIVVNVAVCISVYIRIPVRAHGLLDTPVQAPALRHKHDEYEGDHQPGHCL